MNSRFGIIGICKNPSCGKSFALPEPNNPRLKLHFDTLDQALSAVEEFKKGTFTKQILDNIDKALGLAGGLPMYVECEHCNAIYVRSDVQYFIVRLSGVLGDFPLSRTQLEDGAQQIPAIGTDTERETD